MSLSIVKGEAPSQGVVGSLIVVNNSTGKTAGKPLVADCTPTNTGKYLYSVLLSSVGSLYG
jgi:hypothetical protein